MEKGKNQGKRSCIIMIKNYIIVINRRQMQKKFQFREQSHGHRKIQEADLKKRVVQRRYLVQYGDGEKFIVEAEADQFCGR